MWLAWLALVLLAPLVCSINQTNCLCKGDTLCRGGTAYRFYGVVCCLILLFCTPCGYVRCDGCFGNRAGGSVSAQGGKRFPETAADAELVFIYGLLGMFVGAKLLSLLTVLPELRTDLPLLTSDIGAFSVSIYMRALSFMAACMVFCQPFGFMQSWQDVNLLYWQGPICRSCR